ncbi:MAG: hypothetical protein JO051_04740 [Acidobacteriaceae bacterium]|nr:hypothetical protein [Acidobacteriaceae bacterium]
MSNQMGMPPRWAEFVLEHILPEGDRQSVTGDLREEYAETMLPRNGRLKADLWYLRQLLSLSPRAFSGQSSSRAAVLLVSFFTFACGCWLALMECVLRHPHYVARAGMDITIALVPLTTIAVVCLHLSVRAERWLWAGAVGLIAVAVRAFLHDVHSSHFEGFVLLISLTLAVQGIFMLLFLGRAGRRQLRHGTAGSK